MKSNCYEIRSTEIAIAHQTTILMGLDLIEDNRESLVALLTVDNMRRKNVGETNRSKKNNLSDNGAVICNHILILVDQRPSSRRRSYLVRRIVSFQSSLK